VGTGAGGSGAAAPTEGGPDVTAGGTAPAGAGTEGGAAAGLGAAVVRVVGPDVAGGAKAVNIVADVVSADCRPEQSPLAVVAQFVVTNWLSILTWFSTASTPCVGTGVAWPLRSLTRANPVCALAKCSFRSAVTIGASPSVPRLAMY
jgi:hypothetical protein